MSSINLFGFTAGRKAKPVVEPIGGICDSCGKFERDLKRHMETEHSEAKKCHHCSFEISDQNKLNLHYLVRSISFWMLFKSRSLYLDNIKRNIYVFSEIFLQLES